MSPTAARGSASSAAISFSRVTTMHRTGPTAWMSAMRAPTGSSTSISPIRSPTPRVSAPPRPLDPNRAFDDEQELGARLAATHDRLAVLVRALDPEREDRLEQLLREHREHARVAHEPLVAAAVEKERLALAVVRVLDLPEEERVVAAPVRADDARDEVRERALDERRRHGRARSAAPRPSRPRDRRSGPTVTPGRPRARSRRSARPRAEGCSSALVGRRRRARAAGGATPT